MGVSSRACGSLQEEHQNSYQAWFPKGFLEEVAVEPALGGKGGLGLWTRKQGSRSPGDPFGAQVGSGHVHGRVSLAVKLPAGLRGQDRCLGGCGGQL